LKDPLKNRAAHTRTRKIYDPAKALGKINLLMQKCLAATTPRPNLTALSHWRPRRDDLAS
jgi:hypothetical protein